MSETDLSLEAVRSGGKRALAAALARIETDLSAPDVANLLDTALTAPQGFSLGLTGPPGVGKSTLTDALIRAWRANGRTIAVIAVDPSSLRSGGALLGDRTRLTTDPADTGVFVRSMAARDRLGGIAEITLPAMVLMRALYDLVLIETVGVGQSETAIGEVADITAYCAQPGSGDALQYMKAGIMEIPDIAIVTKSDMGEVAHRTVADLKGALSLADRSNVDVLACSATTGHGLAELVAHISLTIARFSPDLGEQRRLQVIRWGERQIVSRFGREGLDLVHRIGVDNSTCSPFGCASSQIQRLSAAFTEAFR